MVIVSRGPWEPFEGGEAKDALELLWEDDSETPFALHIAIEQSDRQLPEHNQGGGFVITAWTRGGLKGRWPGRYREVEAIPHLQPWKAH
ncbi:hypothetical protein [Thioalkalivibrio sp. ALE16]|uniref:hypothetical protein n=1 Tax=Thioalkalivibrio sp. ALE16 TaxID=1158172 RepID=UPI001E3CEE8C|nr:hypothetical protein [Thioalkalivibrio sp. ALE16]